MQNNWTVESQKRNTRQKVFGLVGGSLVIATWWTHVCLKSCNAKHDPATPNQQKFKHFSLECLKKNGSFLPIENSNQKRSVVIWMIFVLFFSPSSLSLLFSLSSFSSFSSSSLNLYIIFVSLFTLKNISCRPVFSNLKHYLGKKGVYVFEQFLIFFFQYKIYFSFLLNYWTVPPGEETKENEKGGKGEK